MPRGRWCHLDVYLYPIHWPAPSWLVSSIGRALHRYRRGHGFKSRTGLNFFQVLFTTTSFSSVLSCEDLLISRLQSFKKTRKLLFRSLSFTGTDFSQCLCSPIKCSSVAVVSLILCRFLALETVFVMLSFIYDFLSTASGRDVYFLYTLGSNTQDIKTSKDL